MKRKPMVGCEKDGLIRVHPESEVCDVCSPTVEWPIMSPYERGEDAFYIGRRKDENPYRPYSPEADEWSRGFRAAFNSEDHFDGRSLYEG